MEEMKEGMRSIGRNLTKEGFENVKKLDINGNGKLEEDEIHVGNDYFNFNRPFNPPPSIRPDGSIYMDTCTMCEIIQCSDKFACTILFMK